MADASPVELGTACFQFLRPRIADNAAHAAGGVRFEILEPWRHHRVTYAGDVCFLRDPHEMAEPSAAFRNNPQVPVELALDWRGVSPAWGGEPRRRTPDGGFEPAALGDPGRQFARGHFEQHGAVDGALRIADRHYALRGHGLRDHSWGPRFWQNTGWYRWLTITLGTDLAMMALVSEREGGASSRGVVFRKGRPNVEVSRVDLESDLSGPEGTHTALRARVHAADGETFDVEGRVHALVPCRNRRAGWLTRISEAMTEWHVGERRGYGMSEYLDHLVKGE